MLMKALPTGCMGELSAVHPASTTVQAPKDDIKPESSDHVTQNTLVQCKARAD